MSGPKKADAPQLPEKISADQFARSTTELGELTDEFKRTIFYITLTPIIDGRNQIKIDRKNIKCRSWFNMEIPIGPGYLEQIAYNKNKIAILGEYIYSEMTLDVHVFYANNGQYFTISELLDCIEYVRQEKIWCINIAEEKSDKFNELKWDSTMGWFVIFVHFRLQ